MTPASRSGMTDEWGDATVPADVGIERIDFDFDATLADPGFDVLSDEERERAHHFVRPHDRIRFAATRAALRRRLAAVLDRPGASLRFVAAATGRPGLATDPLGATIDFNVSHSGDHALIAWSRLRRVGVDVEVRLQDWDWRPLGRLVFGPADARAVAAAADDDRRARLFHDVWVAKEALLKAEGRGIGVDLDGFSVLWGDDPQEAVREGSDLAAILRSFRFRWLRDIPGHAACLAWSADEAPERPAR